MKHMPLLLAVLLVFAGNIYAQTSQDYLDLYFSDSKNPVLTQQEREALKMVEKWAAGDKSNAPLVAGEDGSVQFVYGVAQPSILCAVLQVTDIELEPGESVNNLHLGDTARWNIEPAITGSANGDILHLIIKPRDVGLQTSLIVTTNRRTYHMRLRSHKTSYMPRVSFIYPEVALAKWQNVQTMAKQDYQEKVMPATGEYLGDLDFDYKIDGYAKLKPVRVYNDGVKTIIQMPKRMLNDEAPTLLVLGPGSNTPQIVNYRLQGDRYVVDAVFERAILIIGVGTQQQKVTITRRNTDSSSENSGNIGGQ